MADEQAPQSSLPEPGVIAPWDYSPEENSQLSEKAQQWLTTLCEKFAKRDMAARRFEVEQSWKAGMFKRGYQYLLPQKGGGWITWQAKNPETWNANPGLNTNIYTPYHDIIVSALTRDTPEVRFEPEDPENDGDITAADAAGDFIKVFERNNDLLTLHTDISSYLFTDGRSHVYTRYVKDAQQFGYEQETDEEPVVPEDEEQQQPPDPDTLSGQAASTEGMAQENTGGIQQESGQSSGKQPRGREVAEAFGKLSVKVPINTKKQSQWHALSLSREWDVSIAKATFPWIADKIAPSSSPGENELDRIARINIGLALGSSYVTGDSMVNDVTVQGVWFRPAAFMEVSDIPVRDELMGLFADKGGCLVVHAGKTFAFARPECMDDHWSVIKANPSDSMNCPGQGEWLIPIQERVNNLVDLLYAFFVATVPRKHFDSKAFNIEALKNQTNYPGESGPFVRQPGTPVSELVFIEPSPQHQPELPDFLWKMINEIAQLLTGAYPALSGGDTEGNDTASGIATQRDQALGRLGLVWHSIQAATANYHRQAVQCAARCRERDVKQLIGESDTVIIELNDLKGNVLCFPESDTSFPESWTQRQQRFTALLQDSKNPVIQTLLQLPNNLRVAKDAVGLTDFEIPQADSVDKQRGEFEVLMKTGPVPNPKLQQAQQLMQSAQMKGAPPEALQQAEQMIQQIPPEVSTVPVDPDWDDHEAEAATCGQFINSPTGRKMKNGTPEEQAGLANIALHGMEHKALIKAPQPQQKPVSEQISLKDLPPEGQQQMAAQAGIQITPQQVAARAIAEKPPAPIVQPGGPIQ